MIRKENIITNDKRLLEQSVSKALVTETVLPVKVLEETINDPIVEDNVQTLPAIYLTEQETKNFNIDEVLRRSQAFK